MKPEQIKEFIKQSYVWVKLPEPFYKTDDDVSGFLDFDKEKFAQLCYQEGYDAGWEDAILKERG